MISVENLLPVGSLACDSAVILSTTLMFTVRYNSEQENVCCNFLHSMTIYVDALRDDMYWAKIMCFFYFFVIHLQVSEASMKRIRYMNHTHQCLSSGCLFPLPMFCLMILIGLLDLWRDVDALTEQMGWQRLIWGSGLFSRWFKHRRKGERGITVLGKGVIHS